MIKNKKLISLITALSLTIPMLTTLPARAELKDGTFESQEQPLTVVGKRIKGDNTYFEISLEVNGEHEDYTSVGVVLEYNPEYIIPADSWDDGAGAADMSENVSWATRRALPTLGKDTWTTHTALAYESTKEVDDGSGGTKTVPVGYLYLGAEYPGETTTTDSAEAPSATGEAATPTPTATAAAADPNATTAPTPAPGTNPIVVARFMYKTAEADKTAGTPAVTGAEVKARIVDEWVTNAANAADPTDTNYSWDLHYDWANPVNTILDLAPDEIAAKSPAQYPFAIYTKDYGNSVSGFTEKAYMRVFPSPEPTVDPYVIGSGTDPTPTPKPAYAYTVSVGANLTDESARLKKDELRIITCEGDSAKMTGGLKLSDIYTILFFDWDDSLIGTLTAGVGAEGMNKTVSDYVESTMVHPQLQGDREHLDSLERRYTYRGEYPYTGPADALDTSKPNKPGSSDPDLVVANGSDYPVTNKLDYVLGGKTFYENAPYAGGWVEVTADKMSETFTWITKTDFQNGYYGKIDYETGWAYGSDGQPSETAALPTLISCDFDHKELAENQNTVMVKTMYVGGDDLNNPNMYYTQDDNVSYSMLTTITAASKSYGINFGYRRVNDHGYGINRLKKPGVKLSIKQFGASGSTPIESSCDNGEVISLMIAPTDAVDTVDYQLVELYGLNIFTAATGSLASTTPFSIGTSYSGGIRTQAEFQVFQNQCYDLGQNKTTFNFTYQNLKSMGFKFKYTTSTKKFTEFSSAANVTQAKNFIKFYMQKASKTPNFQTDPQSFTWYQIADAILTGATTAAKAVYKTPDAARTYCQSIGLYAPAAYEPQ